ncbi:MAG: cobyric acid synthase [Pseudomonadota bacterium]
MIQGAGSNVGKSLFVAGLARALTKRGLKVAPFKPQNMSNNAAVTADGGEIGRAQALQARACGLAPITDMNPVLLKPETEKGAQVIVQGKRLTTVEAKDYGALKSQLLHKVLESFNRLRAQYDIVLVEGAGSPAEVNLRKGDIANMGFAEAADIPVVLLGDIDRGGVIAQMVGTHQVLSAQDRSRIKAFAINKFRGDTTLFKDGMSRIAAETGWAALGILPWFQHAHLLPAEDASDLKSQPSKDGAKVVVPKLSRIANFDDLDPLSNDPNIDVILVEPGQPLPLDAAMVLIPGSKSTIGDLAYFKEQGWHHDLRALVRAGVPVLGICGGYQMLGTKIHDPEGIEGPAGSVDGLGYLNVETVMTPKKRLAEVAGTLKGFDLALRGYEIHIGQTDGPDIENAWLSIDGKDHGAASPNGQIKGCYLHGMFESDAFRKYFFAQIGIKTDLQNFSDTVETTLDALADHIKTHCDMDQIIKLAR